MTEHGGARSADPGLQPERTALAWTRTALAVAVNAVLLLRTGVVGGSPVYLAAGLLLLAAAGATAGYAVIRKRQLGRAVGPPQSSPLPLALTAGMTVAACAAGIAAVLSRP